VKREAEEDWGKKQMAPLILKHASASRLSGEWNDDDYDVLADGIVVGRIMKAAAAPVGQPSLWTLAYGHHEDRWPTHGYEPTREAAMAAFAKSWRREKSHPLTHGYAETRGAAMAAFAKSWRRQ
jgi:hypothetical protein